MAQNVFSNNWTTGAVTLFSSIPTVATNFKIRKNKNLSGWRKDRTPRAGTDVAAKERNPAPKTTTAGR
jgi:hypothetical protein